MYRPTRSKMAEDFDWPDRFQTQRNATAGGKVSLFETTERRVAKAGGAGLVSRSAEYISGFRGRHNRFVEFVEGGGLGDTKCPEGIFGLGFASNSQDSMTSSRAEFVQNQQKDAMNRSQARQQARQARHHINNPNNYRAPDGKIIVQDHADQGALNAMKGHQTDYEYKHQHQKYQKQKRGKRRIKL